MKYVIMVSHGQFAEGLANAVKMLAGEKKEVIAVGLMDGQSADEFADHLNVAFQNIHQEDEVVLLGDLIGGSPLTTAMNVLADKGMTQQSVVIGGMNLPLALTTVLMKDAFDQAALVEQVLHEAHGAMKEFKLINEDEEDI